MRENVIEIGKDKDVIVQGLPRYSAITNLTTWPPIASWNLFYDKSCVFALELNWHRSPVEESLGTCSKLDFRAFT